MSKSGVSTAALLLISIILISAAPLRAHGENKDEEQFILEPGSRGERVARLQQNLLKLARAGKLKLDYDFRVDGSYNQATMRMVNAYKESNRLKNDGFYSGKVGKTTWDRLSSDSDLIKLEEPYITKAIVLNDEDNLPTYGHNGILLYKSDGSGIYYSYLAQCNTKLDDFKFGTGFSSEGFLVKAKLNKEQVTEFLKSGSVEKQIGKKNLRFRKGGKTWGRNENQKYDRYLLLNVSVMQGEEIAQRAERIYMDETDYYNLYKYNCNHAVQKILEAAELNFTGTKGDSFKVVDAIINSRIWPDSINDYLKILSIDGIVPNGAYEMGVKKGYPNGYLKEIWNDLK